VDVTAGQDGFLAGRDQHIDNRKISFDSVSIPHPSEVNVQSRVFWTPRPAVRMFKGRAEALGVLESAFDERGGTVVTQVVYGLGGVGKSELALQYTSRHRADHGLTWWITAVDPGQIEAGLATLAGRLWPQVPLAGTTSDAAEWAIGWLQAHDGWLLILDNVEDPADIEPLLGQLGSGHVIVTTRIDDDWSRIADPMRLDILDADAAVELLAARTGRRGSEDLVALARITKELGCLPLALDQAAAYITAQRVTPLDYAERLRQYPAKLYAAGSGGNAQRTIARLWDVHIAAIKAASETAADLLNVLSWYAPDAIPRVMVGGNAPRAETDEALAMLARYSLITLTEDAVTIHRLLQAIILKRAEKASRAMALDWLTSILPDDPDRDVACWPMLRDVAPHAEALSVRFPQTEQPELLGFTQNQMAVFLNTQGDHLRALALGCSALEIYEAVLGPDHPDTAACLGNLAVTYWALGRAKDAVPMAHRALGIAEATLGPNHPDIAARLEVLAVTYRMLGRAKDAVPLGQRALRIAAATLGPDHPDLAIYLGNLAAIYWELGRVEGALTLAERALQTADPDHLDTSILLGNLAAMYRESWRAGDALRLEERALRIVETTLGPDHPLIATRLGNLASMYRDQARAADALPLEERALRVTETALGPDHPDTAIRLDNLALTYRALGRDDGSPRQVWRPLYLRTAC
jgi:tetratricopeptide (TPR) repeat protein